MVSVLAANLVSIYIECTLFGIFLILSFTSLVLLARRQRAAFGLQYNTPRLSTWPHRLAYLFAMLKSPLIAANVLLILVNTVHWVIAMHRFYIAIVDHDNTQGAVDYVNDLAQPLEIGRTALLFVDMLVGDIVMNYRTWLVWKRDYRAIIFPCITTAGLLASGIGILYEFGTLNADSGPFTATFGPWILAECVSTLCTNLYDTLMIAYKIYSLNRLSKKNGLMIASGNSLMEGLVIFIESAALYSAWTTMFVILYVSGSSLQTIGSGCGPTVIGIAFMLITVRVGLGLGFDTRRAGNPSTTLPSRLGDRPFSENTIPMHAIALDISRTVEQEVDYSLTSKTGHATSLGTDV
ncbi:hypothetical protein BD414DRAFT_474685 [Trametes punicea]|nr:hypothetical protein BD414DRAFT_474685 [Trametes punicea]